MIAPRNIRSFTLLELIIVVVVVGVLSALAIPRLQLTMLQGRVVEARLNLSFIRKMILAYRMKTRENPLGSDEGPWKEFATLGIDDPNDDPAGSFMYYVRAAGIDFGGTYLNASPDSLRLMAYYPKSVPYDLNSIVQQATVVVSLREDGTTSAYRIGAGDKARWFGPIN